MHAHCRWYIVRCSWCYMTVQAQYLSKEEIAHSIIFWSVSINQTSAVAVAAVYVKNANEVQLVFCLSYHHDVHFLVVVVSKLDDKTIKIKSKNKTRKLWFRQSAQTKPLLTIGIPDNRSIRVNSLSLEWCWCLRCINSRASLTDSLTG